MERPKRSVCLSFFSDERLFSEYHGEISEALSVLAQAIQIIVSDRPTGEDDPTPTSAHITLKFLIEKLLEDVKGNPIIHVSSMNNCVFF